MARRSGTGSTRRWCRSRSEHGRPRSIDALSLMAGNDNRKHFEAGSDAAMALGIVSSLPSALSGASDWADVYGKPQRYGMVHALLNGVALTSPAVSMAARRGPAQPDARPDDGRDRVRRIERLWPRSAAISSTTWA
ncbi:MAG: hypothetical protein R2849_19600 [Thermomicrobiales bacterium]